MIFKEVFENYLNINKIHPAITEGVFKSTSLSSENRTVTVYLEMSQLVNRKDLHKAEDELKRALSLRSATIKPYFGESLFTPKYFHDLVDDLKVKRFPRINGTFGDCDVDYDGETLRINLKNGGKAILDDIKFDVELQRLIYEEFGISLKVEYDGVVEVDSESKAYMELQRNTEKKLERESLEKFAELINDGKSHQGEFIELSPIVEE